MQLQRMITQKSSLTKETRQMTKLRWGQVEGFKLCPGVGHKTGQISEGGVYFAELVFIEDLNYLF